MTCAMCKKVTERTSQKFVNRFHFQLRTDNAYFPLCVSRHIFVLSMSILTVVPIHFCSGQQFLTKSTPLWSSLMWFLLCACITVFAWGVPVDFHGVYFWNECPVASGCAVPCNFILILTLPVLCVFCCLRWTRVGISKLYNVV